MQISRVLSLLIVLTACASGARHVAEPQVERTTSIRSAEGTVELRTTRSDPTNEFPIVGTADQLWKAMPVVFAQLDVPVTMREPTSHAMGNRSFRVRRKLGDVRLSRYLDCGNQMGLPNAESYDITLRLEMRVITIATGGVHLATVVQAMARPMDSSGNSVPCSSTGSLERRLVELMTEQVGRG